MTVKLAPVRYGMKEIRNLSHRYTFEGLSLAILFHFIVIGLYFVLRPLEPHEIVLPYYRPPFILPPPSIIDDGSNIQIGNFVVPKANAGLGLPVPVPVIELKEEQTFTDPKDVTPIVGDQGEKQGEHFGNPTGNAGVVGLPMDDIIDLTTTFNENIRFPQSVREIKPTYPDDALRLGMEGMVVVKLLVDKEGKPQQAEVFSSHNELFNKNAKEAAMKWLFTPAIMNGYKVSVWVTVPFRFKLNR